ncbi:hypothetical protein Bbelb_251030 [Branchiostoma belcheri]|nr:hypothetical protein Bbelb_251030 [Branchiostoma belcheri]
MGNSTEEGRRNDTAVSGSVDPQNSNQQVLQGAQNTVLQDSFLPHITDIQRLQEQTQSLLNNAQKTQNLLDTQASQMFKIGVNVPVDPNQNPNLHPFARPGPASPPGRNATAPGLLTSHLAQPPFPGSIGFMPMPLGMMGLPLRPGMPIPPMLSPLFGHPGLLPAVVGKAAVETASAGQSATRPAGIPGGGGAPHVMAGLQEGLTLEQLKVIQDIVSKFPKEKSVGPRIVAPSPELVQAWQNALQSSSQSTVSPTGQESSKDGKPVTAHSAEQIRKWQKLSQRTDGEMPSGSGVRDGGNGARDEMPAGYLGQQQELSLVHNGSSSRLESAASVQEAVDVDTPLAKESETELQKGREVFSAPKSRGSNFLRAERVGSLGYWTPGRPRRGRTFHTCHICGKVFRRPSEVQRHLRVHTGEQPFQCDLCYRRFNDKSNWRNHMIRVHRIESPVWPSWSQDGTTREDTFLQRAADNGELSDEATNLEINNQVNSDDLQSSAVQNAESVEEVLAESDGQAMVEEGLDLSMKDQLQSSQALVKEEEERGSTELIDDSLEKGSEFPPTEERSLKVEETVEDNQEEKMVSQEAMRQHVMPEETGSAVVDNEEEEGTTLQVKQEPPSPETMTAASERQFLEQYEEQSSQDSLEETGDTDPEKTIYHCETCQKPFSRVDSLRRHRILHTGVKPHGCPFCPYRTYYKGNLNVHMERAHSAELHDLKQRELFNFGTLAGKQAVSPSSQYVADLSNEESQTTANQQMDAGVSNISQSCNVCGELFDQDNLTAEMVHHAALHQTNKVSHDVFYSCNMCKAKFRSREGLENHKEQIHQSEVYGRMITKVSESYLSYTHTTGNATGKIVSESYLSYTHTTGNATGKIVTKYFHRCNLCGKKFDRPSGALRHTRVHTGEKPFTCSRRIALQ